MAKKAKNYLPEETDVLLQLRKNMRLLRMNAGLGQCTVSQVLHISRSTYSYYETGTTIPSPITLYRLSQFYGVPAEVFFTPNAVPDLYPNIRRVRSHLESQAIKDPTNIFESKSRRTK